MSQNSTEEVQDERQEEVSETPLDVSMACTGIQMKSLTFGLASNAERHSQAQGSRGFPCIHLSAEGWGHSTSELEKVPYFL